MNERIGRRGIGRILAGSLLAAWLIGPPAAVSSGAESPPAPKEGPARHPGRTGVASQILPDVSWRQEAARRPEPGGDLGERWLSRIERSGKRCGIASRRGRCRRRISCSRWPRSVRRCPPGSKASWRGRRWTAAPTPVRCAPPAQRARIPELSPRPRHDQGQRAAQKGGLRRQTGRQRQPLSFDSPASRTPLRLCLPNPAARYQRRRLRHHRREPVDPAVPDGEVPALLEAPPGRHVHPQSHPGAIVPVASLPRRHDRSEGALAQGASRHHGKHFRAS